MTRTRPMLRLLLLLVLALPACGRGAGAEVASPADSPCRDPQYIELHDRRDRLTPVEERTYQQLDFECRAHRVRAGAGDSGIPPEVVRQETMPWVFGVLMSIGFFYIFTGTTGT